MSILDSFISLLRWLLRVARDLSVVFASMHVLLGDALREAERTTAPHIRLL